MQFNSMHISKLDGLFQMTMHVAAAQEIYDFFCLCDTDVEG